MVRSWLFLFVLATPGMAQITTRVSVDSKGLELKIPVGPGSMSADGRFLALHDGLLIQLYDRKLGSIETVTVDPNGAPLNDSYYDCSISADGRYVAFSSRREHVLWDQNHASDVFVRDAILDVTHLISLSWNDNQLWGDSMNAEMSRDGSHVAFTSWANNVVPGDNNNWIDIFVRDLTTGRNYQVNVDSNGVPSKPILFAGFKQGTWAGHGISKDGRYTVFTSLAGDLVRDDTNGEYDCFVHDLLTRTTERISLAWDGSEAILGGGGDAISANGRYVVFGSADPSLVPNDTNGVADLFVRDRFRSTTLRVNVDSQGTQTTGMLGAGLSRVFMRRMSRT